MLKPSLYIEDFIKGFETLRLTAYKPTPNDVWTIGWGHTRDVNKGDSIDVETAKRFFHEDLDTFADGVLDYVSAFPTTQNQFDAMVSLAFNIGLGNFSHSTVLRKHSQADYAGAAEAFKMWNKQKGKVLNGLVKRRKAEAELYANSTTCPV